jgi:hypothetical protein
VLGRKDGRPEDAGRTRPGWTACGTFLPCPAVLENPTLPPVMLLAGAVVVKVKRAIGQLLLRRIAFNQGG